MRPKLAIALTAGIVAVEGIIFDMDGVLSDTQPIHAQAESELLRQYGIDLSADEITREFAGVTGEEMFPRIFSRYGKHTDHLAELLERRWKMVEGASRGRVRPIPGALDLVAAFRRHGLPLAVASSSRRSYIELVLQELGLSEAFLATVSADDVARGKPAPDIFLLAANRMGIAPESCLVIEDAVSGMQAAKSAGMYCIGLVSPGGQPGDLPAQLLVKTLGEIPSRFQS